MIAAGCALIVSAASNSSDYKGWRTYGGTPDQIRYSALDQINRSNVSKLAVAWMYDTGEGGDLQTQPIVIDGVLYAYTPTHKTIALDAATGQLLWQFDSGIEGRGANRGLMYWARRSDRRIFAAVDEYVYALDAKTGDQLWLAQGAVPQEITGGSASSPASEQLAVEGAALAELTTADQCQGSCHRRGSPPIRGGPAARPSRHATHSGATSPPPGAGSLAAGK